MHKRSCLDGPKVSNICICPVGSFEWRAIAQCRVCNAIAQVEISASTLPTESAADLSLQASSAGER